MTATLAGLLCSTKCKTESRDGKSGVACGIVLKRSQIIKFIAMDALASIVLMLPRMVGFNSSESNTAFTVGFGNICVGFGPWAFVCGTKWED